MPPPNIRTFPWLSTWLCSITRLSKTTQPLSIETPCWTSDDVTIDPDVTLEGSSTVDRIVAYSTTHDWNERTTTARKSVAHTRKNCFSFCLFLKHVPKQNVTLQNKTKQKHKKKGKKIKKKYGINLIC